MPINTVPLAAPAPVEGALSNAQAAAAARAKAIAAFNKSAATEAPKEEIKEEEEQKQPETASAGQDSINESQATEVTDEATSNPPAKAPAPESEQLSAQYAQLARREKALRTQSMQIKQQNEQFAAREAAIKAKEAELQGNGNYIPKERLTKETLQVLEEAGIDYEQITQMALNGPSVEARQQAQTISKLEAKIAALEEGQTKVTKSFEDNQKNQYNQAITQIRNEAKHAVYTNPEFEITKETNSVEDVVELITKTFEQDGILLTVDEAAKAVEEHLYEEAFKLTKLSKIQKRIAERAVATAPQAASGKQAESDGKKPAMKTLTNSIGSSRPLSAKERAVLAFKGELK